MVVTDHLHAPRVSVAEHMAIMRERLRRAGAATFRSLVADCATTLEVVARFLGLLELYRDGAVAFDQAAALTELRVRWIGTPTTDRRGDDIDEEYGHDEPRRASATAASRPARLSRRPSAGSPRSTRRCRPVGRWRSPTSGAGRRGRGDPVRRRRPDHAPPRSPPPCRRRRPTVRRALAGLRAGYDERGAGIELREVAGGVRIYTRPAHAASSSATCRTASGSRLTQAALETLAVIAYRQPVTRAPGLGDPRRERRRRSCAPCSAAA